MNTLPSDTTSAIMLATGPDIVWKALLGRPVLAWSLRTFELAESVDRIALVVTPERAHEAEVLAHVEAWRKTQIVVAPQHWPEATLAGLRALTAAPHSSSGQDGSSEDGSGGLVVVHEATRPLVTLRLIADGIAAARTTGAAAAGEPVNETIKRVRGGLIVETVARDRLVRAQTPQAYSVHALRTTLDYALGQTADVSTATTPAHLAALALAAGLSVAVFAGDAANLSVRAADDLAVAEALLRRRTGG